MKSKAKQKNRAMVTAPGRSAGRLFLKKAKQSKAKLNKAMQGKANLSKAKQSKAKLSKAKQCKAKQSKQNKATFASLPFSLHVLVSTEPCLEKMDPGCASSSMYSLLCMIFR